MRRLQESQGNNTLWLGWQTCAWQRINDKKSLQQQQHNLQGTRHDRPVVGSIATSQHPSSTQAHDTQHVVVHMALLLGNTHNVCARTWVCWGPCLQRQQPTTGRLQTDELHWAAWLSPTHTAALTLSRSRAARRTPCTVGAHVEAPTRTSSNRPRCSVLSCPTRIDNSGCQRAVAATHKPSPCLHTAEARLR